MLECTLLKFGALMQRGSQINGELSKEELKLLAKIGATYCWSVIVENDDSVSSP
jgi:hypothetical protein